MSLAAVFSLLLKRQCKCSALLPVVRSLRHRAVIDMNDDMDRKVPTTNAEHFNATKREPMMPANAKILRLSILGAPNAGKSELTNQLVGASVSAVSAKIDTTRMTTTGVATDKNTQLLILDTPGIVSRKRARDVLGINPDDRMVTDPETSVEKADLIVVLFDATAPGDYLHHRILHILHRHTHVPSILVVNKVDLVADRPRLLELIRILTKGQVAGQPVSAVRKTIGRLSGKASTKTVPLHLAGQKDKGPEWHQLYSKLLNMPTHRILWPDTKKLFKDEKGWAHFEAVFYTSALTGEGVDDLKKYLYSRARTGEWRYHSSVMTTKTPQQLCIDCLRGKLLDHLPHNVPYQLDIKVAYWQVDEHDLLKIVLDVQCEKDQHARLLIGTGGDRIHTISAEANQELRNLFQREVFLKVAVKFSNGLTAAPPTERSDHQRTPATKVKQ